jgi:hypothetical protein
MCRLIATAIALSATVLGVTILDSFAPAWAGDNCSRVNRYGMCLSDATHAPVPDTPPQGGGESATGTFNGAGPRVCRDEGKVIPCSKGGFSWMSSPTGSCYGAVMDDAPANDPGWAGHNASEGSIAYCPLDGISGVTFFLPNGAAPQIVDAAAIARAMLARAPFEVANLQMAPPYGSHTYIRIENWFWVPEGQWHNVSLTEDVGPAAVTLTAEPSRLVVDTGNNSPAPASCSDAGRPWRDGMSNAAQTTCSYTYESIKNPSGDTYNVSGRIYYEVSWTCAGACSAPAGALGEYPAPASEEHPVEVRQRQTVVTQ